MTYEQASARGLVFTRTDDRLLTYRDGIMHHFNAAMTTAVTAARNRERLMRDFYEFRKTAIEGERAMREYVIVPGVDPSRAWRLAMNLATQGVDVRRAEESVQIGNRTMPAGAYLVSNAQPTGRLVRNLLDPQTEQDAAFVREQDRRRRLRMGDEIYDITAWSLPLLYDVEVLTSETRLTPRTTALSTAPAPPATAQASAGGVPGAVGQRHGRCGCRGAARRHSGAARGTRADPERPPLSDWHRDLQDFRERTGSRDEARRHRREVPRRSGSYRHRLPGGRHFAGQRERRRR